MGIVAPLINPDYFILAKMVKIQPANKSAVPGDILIAWLLNGLQPGGEFFYKLHILSVI